MSTNLGFYGCNYDYQLITDIMESWGDDLYGLEDCDRYYLIHMISEYIGLIHFVHQDTTEAADELGSRIIAHELPAPQLKALMLAIVYRKPLGYWGLDCRVPLINDVYETYGDYLENLTGEEVYDILTPIGWKLYVDSPGISSVEADEVVERLDELPLSQLQALIQALVSN